MFALFTLSSAALAGLAALLGLWPFAGVQAVVTTLVYGEPSTAPIQATTIFPSVPPTHQVVNVYDPPAPSTRPRPTSNEPASAPEPEAPSPTGEPPEGPEPGDD